MASLLQMTDLTLMLNRSAEFHDLDFLLLSGRSSLRVINGEVDRGEDASVCCLTANAAVNTDFQPFFAPSLSGDADSWNIKEE